ncbi:MAG: tetratricopeptide repeat protein [Pseudomonadales bacterium]
MTDYRHLRTRNSLIVLFLVIYLAAPQTSAGIETNGFGPPPGRPEFAWRVQQLMARGDGESADKLLKQVDPEHLNARQLEWFYHIQCYASVGVKAYLRATQHCTRSINNSGAFWHDFVNRGAAHAMLGDYDQAIIDYRSAIRRGGDHAQLTRVILAIQKEQAKQAAIDR